MSKTWPWWLIAFCLLAQASLAGDSTYAKVGGKWVKADVVTVPDQGVVETDSKAKWIQCTAHRIITVEINGVSIDVLSAEPVQVIPIEGGQTLAYGLVAGPGKYSVQFIFSDPETGIQTWTKVIVIDGPAPPEPGPEPEPDPDPTPSPDVPDDEFGSIGRRVASWTAGKPKRSDIKAIYIEVAGKLESGRLLSINDAAGEILSRMKDALTEDERVQWKDFFTGIQADLDGRWPIPRQTYVEWLLAISKGL